jgi:tetratricopeptide (TPR) repeat protein
LVAAPRPLFAACLAVIITTLAGGIARADYVLPDTPANRARGVVGCTQTDTGINCGGGGGGPSEDPGDYYERRGEPANYVNVIRSGNSYRPAPGYRWVNDDPKDFSVVPYADGTPDRDNPNVVWAGDATRRPAPGYGWVSDAADDYRVEPFPDGTPDNDNPNVVWAGDGTRRPLSGYGWVSDAAGDFRVEPYPEGTLDNDNPNVVWAGDGTRRPRLGYYWVSDEAGDFRVEAYAAGTLDNDNPNVVWAGDGTRRPAPGYGWVSDAAGDFRVEAYAAGTLDNDNPNVVWAGDGTRRPAPGYGWVSDAAGDFRVAPYAEGTPDSDYPNVVWAGDGTRRPAPGYGWVSDAVDDLRVELIALEADPEILALAAEAEAAWETSRAMLYDGRWAEAEYYLRQYLAADPDDAWMHSRLGYALLKQGRYAEAVEASRQAAKLAPHESAFQGDLILSLDSYAWTRALDGEMGEARALYSQAIELARGDAELTSKLAGLLNETYRAGAALADGAALLDHRNSSIRSNGRETPCSLSV